MQSDPAKRPYSPRPRCQGAKTGVLSQLSLLLNVDLGLVRILFASRICVRGGGARFA